MYYLIPKGTKIESKRQSNDRISDTDVFVTREEKMIFIKYAHENYPIIMDILIRLYPELNNISVVIPCSSYGCYSGLTLGLSIQAIQAIIENPNIICTGAYVNLPYQRLYYQFIQVTNIIKVEYNGNYCLFIGKNYDQYYIERVLISHTDDQFIPSTPEWVYSMDNTSYQCAVMNKNAFSSGAQTVFIEDKLLDVFINKEYINLETVYIYMHNFDYIKQIDLVRKAFKNVYFIINIKEFAISDYVRLEKFAGNTLLIFLNGSGNERFSKASFRETFMFHSVYLLEKGLCDINSSTLAGKIIDFRTFGVRKDTEFNYTMLDVTLKDSFFTNDAFRHLRTQLGLQTTSAIPNANVTRDNNPYTL